jgi:GxxExxY protein
LEGTIDKLEYSDVTQKIIGASFEVHKFLGNGFQEVNYQRALAYEMGKAGLAFTREIEQEIFYKYLTEPIGTRRADFVVEGKVLVEIKATSALEGDAAVRSQQYRITGPRSFLRQGFIQRCASE